MGLRTHFLVSGGPPGLRQPVRPHPHHPFHKPCNKDAMGCDAIRCDAMRCDVVCCDGMGCGGMGWDGIRQGGKAIRKWGVHAHTRHEGCNHEIIVACGHFRSLTAPQRADTTQQGLPNAMPLSAKAPQCQKNITCSPISLTTITDVFVL